MTYITPVPQNIWLSMVNTYEDDERNGQIKGETSRVIYFFVPLTLILLRKYERGKSMT